MIESIASSLSNRSQDVLEAMDNAALDRRFQIIYGCRVFCRIDEPEFAAGDVVRRGLARSTINFCGQAFDSMPPGASNSEPTTRTIGPIRPWNSLANRDVDALESG